MESSLISAVERYSTNLLTEHLSEKMVFHDITSTHRIVSAIEKICVVEGIGTYDTETVLAAGWLANIGFTNQDVLKKLTQPQDLFRLCYESSISLSKDYLETIEISTERRDQILSLLEEIHLPNQVSSKLGEVLSDALTSDWGMPKGKAKVKKLYEEFLLTGAVNYSKSSWYDTVLSYLREHKYHTSYGNDVLEKNKISLLQKIEKEKKDIDKTANTLIQKEMNISDAELKKLKKSLSSVKGRDERGIQTLFRTTSRNHYTLNQMMDRKANIMISINAILLSLIISRTIGQIDTFCIHNSPILIMLFSAIASMAFAVMAITPFQTQGTFTESEIREKMGNLLYYGNFHNMNFRDFEWGMLEMLSDGDYLYSTMIRDLYFLGQTLHKKSSRIRFSLRLFILGLIVSTVVFVAVSSMEDFHFASAEHI